MHPVAPAPAPAPASTDAGAPPVAPVRPSGWWHLAGVGLMVLGVVLCVTSVRQGFQDAEDIALTASAAAPGEDQPLTLDRVGGYTIAYSGPVIVQTTDDQRRLAEELSISIVPADGGDPLALAPYDGLTPIEEDGQQYVPLLTVSVEQPGEYLLRSSHSPQVDREQSALILHDSPFRLLRSGVERALAFLVGGLFLGTLLVVILARVRGRAKRAAAAARPPQWPGSWSGPAWGPAAGPYR